MLTQVLSDHSKKKWVKETEEIKTLYRKNKEAFTDVSLELMLKILQVPNPKQLDELLTVFLQLYQVLASVAHSSGFTVAEPLFSKHIESAYKLTRFNKKKTVAVKSFQWLEALISAAPVAYFKSSLESDRPSSVLRQLYITSLHVMIGPVGQESP